MSEVRSQPCSACPYRLDVPSGVWAFTEYEKLRRYDEPTFDQPLAVFVCHATPDHYCSGWAVCHTARGNEFDLLALRLAGSPTIPEISVELFESGNDAADHGQLEIDHPTRESIRVQHRLLRKYERLRK